MRFSSIHKKLGACALLAAAIAAGGCFFQESSETGPTGGGGPQGPPADVPKTLDIDPDATIMASGGDGVGIFVEYASGGAWTVFTACDTNTSELPCDIDVFVKPVDASASISNADGTSFEGRDAIELQTDGSVHLFVETSTGLDGMTFSATPDAAMEFEVFLDGIRHPEFIYWVGDGVLHTGSPTDPVSFTPVASSKDGGTDGSGGGGPGTGGGSPGTGGASGGTGGSSAGTGGADAGTGGAGAADAGG